MNDAGRRPIGHGLNAADPPIGKIGHHLAKGRDRFIEESFHGLDGHVPFCNPRTAAGNDQVDTAYPFMEMALDFSPVVLHDLIVDDLVAVLRQQRLNEQAVRIVGKGTAVADSKNGCPQRVFFCFFVIQSKTLLTQDSYDAAIEKGSCPSKSPWRK